MNPIHSLKTLLLTLFMLLLLSLMGCGNHSHTHQQLLHAEAIMEEHPDSAYAIVSSLQIDSTTPEEDRALHALLLTQSMHKTDRLEAELSKDPQKIDSMLRWSGDFFDKEFEHGRLMKTLFYTGIVKFFKEDFSSAVTSLSESLAIAEANNDNYWAARNYETLSDICRVAHQYGDSEKMQRNALAHYEKSGKEDYVRYAWLGVTLSKLNAAKYEEAISLADSLINSSNPALSPTYMPDMWSKYQVVKAKSYFFMNKFEDCIKCIDLLEDADMHDSELDVFHIMSYRNKGEVQQARLLLTKYENELDEEDRLILWNAFSVTDGNKEDELKSMKILYEKEVADKDSLININLNAAHTQASLNTRKRMDNEKRRESRYWLFLLGGIFCMSLLIVFIHYRRRKQMRAKIDDLNDSNELLTDTLNLQLQEKQQLLSLNKTVIQEKENAINERKELESELTELRQLYDDARSDITILRKAGLKFSRLLTVLSKEKDKSTLSPRTTLGKIKIEFDKYRPGARNLKDWETLLNQKYDNILDNLSHDIPDLTKEEKAISVYLIMGFTNASICYLCNLKGRQEEFMITKLRNKIKALPEEKRKRYRLLMSTTQEEDN